jgi:hypothetical protein
MAEAGVSLGYIVHLISLIFIYFLTWGTSRLLSSFHYLLPLCTELAGRVNILVACLTTRGLKLNADICAGPIVVSSVKISKMYVTQT